MADMKSLRDSAELDDYFATRRRAYQERYRTKGIVEGYERGIDAERALLRRQAAHKFGNRLAAGLSDLLVAMDADDLAWAGELIIDYCAGDQLIERLATDRRQVVRRMVDMAKVVRLRESSELEEDAPVRGRACQGQYRAEGVAQGVSAQRELLSRQAARKFGPETAERVEDIVVCIDDPEELARVGESIIDCAKGDELIERIGETLPGAPESPVAADSNAPA